MGLDMIVVLGLALTFFGGISYLIWKERNKQKTQDAKVRAFPERSCAPMDKLHKTKSANR